MCLLECTAGDASGRVAICLRLPKRGRLEVELHLLILYRPSIEADPWRWRVGQARPAQQPVEKERFMHRSPRTACRRYQNTRIARNYARNLAPCQAIRGNQSMN
ncbi:MAG: hypothetical protein ACI841_003009, partial [Planctomycetota bacterium]